MAILYYRSHVRIKLDAAHSHSIADTRIHNLLKTNFVWISIQTHTLVHVKAPLTSSSASDGSLGLGIWVVIINQSDMLQRGYVQG